MTDACLCNVERHSKGKRRSFFLLFCLLFLRRGARVRLPARRSIAHVPVNIENIVAIFGD